METAMEIRTTREMAPASTVEDERSLAEVIRQTTLVGQVMQAVMQKDTHYGLIPGCGTKPSLLKPGAEKLCLTFRLAPEFHTDIVDLGNGHRDYRTACTLRHITTARVLAVAHGSCSTMESKYRYRNAKTPDEPTGVAVPKRYWDRRKENAEAAELVKILSDAVGAPGRYGTAKDDAGVWRIVKRGEATDAKVENPDIADTYNTCLKMAEKRALVAATLIGTAASDIFTQDVEDLAASADRAAAFAPPPAPPPPAREPGDEPEASNGKSMPPRAALFDMIHKSIKGMKSAEGKEFVRKAAESRGINLSGKTLDELSDDDLLALAEATAPLPIQ